MSDFTNQHRREELLWVVDDFKTSFIYFLTVCNKHGWEGWESDIGEDYPFENSFDERVLEVHEWCETLCRLIEEKLPDVDR